MIFCGVVVQNTMAEDYVLQNDDVILTSHRCSQRVRATEAVAVAAGHVRRRHVGVVRRQRSAPTQAVRSLRVDSTR